MTNRDYTKCLRVLSGGPNPSAGGGWRIGNPYVTLGVPRGRMGGNTMELVIEHLQAHAVLYFFGTLIVLPLAIFFHRWLVPILQWALEIAIYMTGVHIATHFTTALVAWFRRESSSEYLAGREFVDWGTPLLRFWDIEAYDPVGIFYFELAALLALTYLVLKIRPMKVQKPPSAAHARSQRRSANRNPRARR
jgi:hypothetical protein